MNGVREFQLFVLSKMRARERVDVALRELMSSRDEMRDVAAHLGEVIGLDATIHGADAYRAVLGAPYSESILTSSEATEHFRGSVCSSYELPLWPEMLFSVNRHPDGYAWGRGFQLRQPWPNLSLKSDLACIVPWQRTIKSLATSASKATTLYGWDEQCDIKFLFCLQGGCSVSYVGEFDMNMLQSWSSTDGTQA